MAASYSQGHQYLYLPASARSSRRAIETSSYTTTPSRSPRSLTPAACGETTIYSYQRVQAASPTTGAAATAAEILLQIQDNGRPDSETVGRTSTNEAAGVASQTATTSDGSGDGSEGVVDMARRAQESETVKMNEGAGEEGEGPQKSQQLPVQSQTRTQTSVGN